MARLRFAWRPTGNWCRFSKVQRWRRADVQSSRALEIITVEKSGHTGSSGSTGRRCPEPLIAGSRVRPASIATDWVAARRTGRHRRLLRWLGTISGTTIGRGLFPEASSFAGGRAYVFTKTATGWHQTPSSRVPHTVAPERLRCLCCTIQSHTIVVGAVCCMPRSTGRAAYVFEG